MANEKPKIVKEEIRESDGHRLVYYESGMVRDETIGRAIRPPDRALITPEKSQEMHQARREQIAKHSKIGVIRGAGIEISSDAPDEEVFTKTQQAAENVNEKAAGLLMSATSARGVEGLFPRVNSVLYGEPDPEAWQQQAREEQAILVQALTPLLELLRAAMQPQPETIEGKTL